MTRGAAINRAKGHEVGNKIKAALLITVTAAVTFGFFRSYDHHLAGPSFTSVHIFLFNLTCGGTLILTLLSGKKDLGDEESAFFVGAVIFSLAAFLGVMSICIACAIVLGLLAESARWKRFGWFPWDFFLDRKASVKFEQASILCLSLGLFICAGSLINNEYLHIVDFKKLNLHVFYLGFSFPISLITFSALFKRIEQGQRPPSRLMSEFAFWALNLGVIFFFVFILLEILPVQFVMASSLFSVVVVTAYLHFRSGIGDARARMLTSALAFLTIGSISGLLYVVVLWLIAGDSYTPGYIINLHSAANVFGWNLTWILLAARTEEYPIRTSPRTLMALHWPMVFLLPLGWISWLFAIPAFVLCAALLYLGLYSPPAADEAS